MSPKRPPRGLAYRTASLRNALLTRLPDSISFGSLRARHIKQPIRIEEMRLTSAHWPRAFDGVRIAHLSDIHFGHLLGAERLAQAVDAVRALRADLVAITGDLVDLSADESPLLFEHLALIQAKLGVFIVLGNHDHLDHPKAIVRGAKEAGLIPLVDDSVRVGGRDGLLVAGIDWAKSIPACAARLRRCGTGRADLLLAHNPKAFVGAEERGIPLTLSGHTHGGQLARSGNRRHNLVFTQRLSAGHYAHGESHLYVTNGVGAWFPLRVNCPPEIAVIEMRSR
ncbi:MAG: metallophosphoesterase [Limnohabitans sp.]|jgi:predicted MPP superfamily phosphohydrolase|nr:metallophosphoesterase [Limnohabitans sp.]